jgi:hypothetical protein
MKCFSKRKCESDTIDDYEIVTMVRMLKWEVKVDNTMEDSLNMKMCQW